MKPEHDPRAREHHAELERFLTKLGVAVTTGDGKAAARLWEVPAFFLGDGMARPIATYEEIAEFFGNARAGYNAKGIQETRPEILQEEWIADGLVQVKVRWPYLDAGMHEVGAETSEYTLARDAGGKLKLRVAVAHGVEGVRERA